MTLGRQHVAAHALGAIVAVLARRRFHACMRNHRGQVNGGDVLGPVDRAWVAVKRGLIVCRQRVPDRHEVVDLIDRFALGVQAVELHVLVGALDVLLAFVELGRPCGLGAAQRKHLQNLLGASGHCLGALELLLHFSACGELPFGHNDWLALGVVQRMLGEPRAHVVDEQFVLQRIDSAACHLGDTWCLLGAQGGDGDDGGDNDVYWDDVDGSFGYAWELGEQSAGVADDDRLGHAKAADPTWARLLQRRLNN